LHIPTKRLDISMKVSVGVVGASGAVGQEIIGVMDNRDFPASTVKLFSSSSSAGSKVATEKFGELIMEEFNFEEASKLDICLLAVGGDFSLKWAEKLADAGVCVIDNSSAFRQKEGVPLVIPEININTAKKGKKKLIANPNCTTAIALMALWPIHQKYKILKAIISTYQAASGAGIPGMRELEEGNKAVVEGRSPEINVFTHQLPYNIIPHIDVFQENDYTKEEMKVMESHTHTLQALSRAKVNNHPI
jgi:aspartate-semialdehyde dehydrogenase